MSPHELVADTPPLPNLDLSALRALDFSSDMLVPAVSPAAATANPAVCGLDDMMVPDDMAGAGLLGPEHALFPDLDPDLLLTTTDVFAWHAAADVKPEPVSVTAPSPVSAVGTTDDDDDDDDGMALDDDRSSSSSSSGGRSSDDTKAVDRRLHKLFPMAALRKPRKEFTAWREAHKIRRLTATESKRLVALRRVVLARVYAERTRLRKQAEHDTIESELGKLQAENDTLRARLATLEAEHASLRLKLSSSSPSSHAGKRTGTRR